MAKPPLSLGTFGRINVAETPYSTKQRPRYKARTRYRGSDGKLVYVSRFGQTKSRAETALRDALRDMQKTFSRDTITAATTIEDLAGMWLDENRPRWAANTVERYELAVRKQVIPRLGAIRVGELRRSLVGRALDAIEKADGPAAAKSAKACLSGMCQLAMQHDALDANPVSKSHTIRAGDTKEAVRALTKDEQHQLSDLLRCDPQAVAWDLPDLVDWMLGTGARIGEACAAHQGVINIPERWWDVNATLVRVKGEGLVIQEHSKSKAGARRLWLPGFCIDILERRAEEPRLQPETVRFMTGKAKTIHTEPNPGIIFPAPMGGLRDPSNTAADLRAVLDRIGCPECGGRGWHPALKTVRQNANRPKLRVDADGAAWNDRCDALPPFAWLHSHIFRKSVATQMDGGGASAREVADQLGHAKIGMTQDAYLARRVVSAEAARILER